MPRKLRKNKEVKETIQDMEVETDAIKKVQTEGIQEMENLKR